MHISHKMQSPAGPPLVVLYGCGNVLLGDDGFGPAVIEHLERVGLPERVRAIDAGTGIREYLLDYLLLPALRPRMLVVIDADPDEDAIPGLVRICDPAALPARKIHDFSLHQFPTVNLLRELGEETGIEVVLVLAGITPPDAVSAPGLSPPLQAAVIESGMRILDLIAPFSAVEVATP